MIASDTNKRPDLIIGALLGLVALAAYAATLCPGAYPGLSAYQIAAHTGLFYQGTAYRFLYTLAARAVDALPFGGLAARLNVFSALCGAASVVFLYGLVSGTVRRVARLDDPQRPRAALAGRIAGVGAGLYLAFSIPFWIASNRAGVAAFDTLLLLAVTAIFYRYVSGGPGWLAPVFGLACGIGVTESATLIVFAPLFGPALLFAMWRRGEATPARIIALVVSTLAGLCLYLVAAWDFHGSPGYVAREYTGFFKVVWFIWREEYLLITRGLPRVGWLVVLFVGVVPGLVAALVARRALNDERDLTYYALHVLLTAIAVLVLLNHRMAPWAMLGEERFLVTPYVLGAALFGYLLAYWLFLPGTWWPDPERRSARRLSRHLGWVFVAPALALACLAAFRNLARADARPGGVADAYARRILDRSAGVEWIVSDGALDMHLLILARDRGRAPRLVNVGAGNSELYMNYLRMQLADEPDLRSAASVSMVALLRRWFDTKPDVDRSVAVIWPADLWMAAGCSMLPEGVVFLGTRRPEDVDADALMGRNAAIWDELVPALRRASAEGSPIAKLASFLLTRLSLGANNLGVFMEDIGRKDEAYAAYARAREINPENVSALLNLNGMLNGGYQPADADKIREATRDFVADLKGKYRVWALSRHDGYVRMAQAYADLGMTWALSGRPGLAVSGIRKAMELAPEAGRNRLAQTLAEMYLRMGETVRSGDMYREMLAANPKDGEALLGLYRVRTLEGNIEAARELLEQAEKAGISKTRVSLEYALLHLRSGDLDQARIVLQELVDLQPRMTEAWELLTDVIALQRDADGLAEAIEKMEKGGGSDRVIYFARARLSALQGDLVAALDNAERALRIFPRDPRVLEFLMQAAMALGRYDDATQHARVMLEIAPANGMGNYVLGSAYLLKNEFVLAEQFLRRALAVRETAEVLNNLAWIVQERGDCAEGEELVRRALALDANTPGAWDTLGVVLMKLGRPDEAEEAMERAVGQSQDELPAMLHLAEVRVRLGKLDGAADLLDVLERRRRELPQREQDRLDDVRRMYRRARERQ